MMDEPHLKRVDWDLETKEDLSYCGACDEAWPCTTERLRLLELRVANLRSYMKSVAESGHMFAEPTVPGTAAALRQAQRMVEFFRMVEYFLVHDRVDENEY